MSKHTRVILGIIAFTAWFAVALQLYLIIINRITPVLETIARFFSFYTILTNIVVALYSTLLFFKPEGKLSSYFSRASATTAIAVYILVVGLIYNLILRSLWAPEGLQRLADELLHVFVPLFFLIYWFVGANKTNLKWKNIIGWLVYPLVYLGLILLRGSVAHYYPYPFINVDSIGYKNVFLNSCGILLLFLVLSCLFIIVAKFVIGKRTKRSL